MYFLTICTQNRECLFGDIVDGEMVLNDAGLITEQCWREIPSHFPQTELDEFVIMPNHVHGIVFITDIVGANIVGAKNFSPLQQHPVATSKTNGSIVRGFKIGVTKWMRQNTSVHYVWQRNYWEHIVRNEQELHRIREYIVNNPKKWELDDNNPKQRGSNNIAEPQWQYGHEPWMV